MLTVDSITAISVTYNSAHCISALAASLASFSRVILIDNGSTDDTPQKIVDLLPQAHLIQSQRNLGFGAANNRALDLVTTDYALLLNPDCIVAQRDIEQLLVAATDYPDAAIIAPQLVRSGGLYEISYRWPNNIWRSTGPNATGACCVGFVSGAAMLLNMAVMRHIGFFDERFFLYYEDEDLCQRVFNARQQIIITPEARFTHLSRGSVRGKYPLRAEFLRGYHHAQSKLIFEQKHHSTASANKLRWRTLLLALLTVIPRLLLPQPKYLARLFGRIIGLSQFQTSQFQ
jgi:N-acetylglucosaminyl-diphospho-decaprenol L-rhamnosyltransferase